VRLIALLNWFDERDDWLERGIRSLAKAPVDVVVAVDGAYKLFPDGRASSPPSNAETIRRACDEIGAECVIHTPETTWQGNEVEKRTFLFRLAEDVAEPNVDWLFVWDADQHLGRCKNLKPRLAATDRDAADLLVIEPPDPRERNPCRPGTNIPMPVQLDVRLMYRAIPGIHCHDNHYTYRTPDGRYLWGNAVTDPLVPGLDLHDVQVLHKTKLRTDSRGGRQLRYYMARKEHRAEDSTCKFCNDKGAVKDIAFGWEWAAKGQGGWHLKSALVPACKDCAVERGTPEDKPLKMPCPECNGKASQCRYCNNTGIYIINNPGQVFKTGRPVTAVTGKVGVPT
jgi:hypothetical protein